MDTPTLLPSPYHLGAPIQTEHQFVGRADTITHVLALLEEVRENVIVIEGPHQVGKTSLLHQLRRRWGVQDGSVLFSLGDQGAGVDIPETLHRLGREIMRVTPTLPYGVGHKGSSAEQRSCQLIDLLNQIAKHRRTKPPFVVMLDDLPALADQDRPPQANPNRYLKMIVQRCPTTKFVIIQTLEPGAGEQTCAQIFRRARRLTVGNLTRAEVAGVCRLSERVAKTQGLRWTDEAIEAVFAVTDGHPLLVQAVCAGIWQRFAAAEQLHTVEREDLDSEAGLRLLLGETGDALARIWATLPVAARAVFILVAQQGNITAVPDLDAAFIARRRWRGALRQARSELRHTGFLVAEGDTMRCSPPLLGFWARRQVLAGAGELQQIIAAANQPSVARSRARPQIPPHASAPLPI
ncbi:MAG: ATP-binding protein [Anaerolineae bacterium]|nr:ATP-binding protein [Anaerolineae bacterium]